MITPPFSSTLLMTHNIHFKPQPSNSTQWSRVTSDRLDTSMGAPSHLWGKAQKHHIPGAGDLRSAAGEMNLERDQEGTIHSTHENPTPDFCKMFYLNHSRNLQKKCCFFHSWHLDHGCHDVVIYFWSIISAKSPIRRVAPDESEAMKGQVI